MNKEIHIRYGHGLAAIGFAFIVFAMLFWGWPHLLVVREQSQLFLWNADYLIERLVIPGGLAQYVAEFLVQFFYYPALGAVICSMLCLSVQALSYRLLDRRLWAWSFVPAVIVAILTIQLYVPLTLTVAILMSLGLLVLLPCSPVARLWALGIFVVVGYWLVGPAVALLLLGCSRRWIAVPALLLAGCIYGSSLLAPYPLRQVVRGIDYYWETHHLGTNEEMACDYLVRQHNWKEIVRRFADSKSSAIHNAVLVAQFQNRTISEKELLHQIHLSKGTLQSQSSAFLMSELYMQMGMAQMAQRAAFEAMEAVPNYSKSGRALRRLVETNLVTGYPDVALKYIGILEETTVYRDFASQMHSLAIHPELLQEHPYYGSLHKIFTESHDTFF